MTDEDLTTLADLVATRLLEGQTDKHGRPLIHHALSVYRRAKAMNLSRDQCIAALLHDCIEDGRVDYPDHERVRVIRTIIHALFGLKVFRIVLALTRETDPDIPQTYDAYIRMIPRYCPEAVPVKLADLEDNLDPERARLFGPIPATLRERYERAREYLLEAQARIERGDRGESPTPSDGAGATGSGSPGRVVRNFGSAG